MRDTKFGSNVPNEMLLNAAKYQGYSFYRFWVIKGKAARGRKITLTSRLGLNLLANPETAYKQSNKILFEIFGTK